MAKSNVSAVTHLLPTVNEDFVTTTGGSIAVAATAVPLTSVVGLTNGTTFVGIIEPGGSKQQVFTGIVDTTGSQITGVKWTRGTNVAHDGGVTVVDYVTGTFMNMITKWAGVQHNDDGTHSSVTATNIVTTALTVGGKDISQLTPAGIVSPFAGASAPTGWLICDGSSKLRTDYPALFTSIGTAYGSADSTHFNVPDLKGRVITGVDASGTRIPANNLLGQAAGEASHVLSYSEMPSHTHGVSDPGHGHNLWTVGQEGNSYPLSGPSTRVVLSGGNPDAGNGRTGASGTGIGIQPAGDYAPHNNLQPYLMMNYIIKA